MADFPENIIVPFIGTVHDRIMLEMFRMHSGLQVLPGGFYIPACKRKDSEVLLNQAKGAIEKRI